jgi:hypothetical protein
VKRRSNEAVMSTKRVAEEEEGEDSKRIKIIDPNDPSILKPVVNPRNHPAYQLQRTFLMNLKRSVEQVVGKAVKADWVETRTSLTRCGEALGEQQSCGVASVIQIIQA